MFSHIWSSVTSATRRPRILVRDIAQRVEKQKKLKTKHERGRTGGNIGASAPARKKAKTTPAAQAAKKRKERHVQWHPETQYVLTRKGIPLDESPELLYKRGELRERHMYHFTHVSPEAQRNMKRPKYAGVFRVRAFEPTSTPHYVRPQDKHLRQMYGYDKQHPLPEGEPSRTNRDLTWTMVTDTCTGVKIPYHIDLFAIRGKRTLQNSKQRRMRKRSNPVGKRTSPVDKRSSPVEKQCSKEG